MQSPGTELPGAALRVCLLGALSLDFCFYPQREVGDVCDLSSVAWEIYGTLSEV